MTKKLTREKLRESLSRRASAWTDESDIIEDMLDTLEVLGYIEAEKEPLTFSQIRKECVSGESVLADEDGYERAYIGFIKKGQLITHCSASNSFLNWSEDIIANWTIKPKEEKKVVEIDEEVWVNVYEYGRSTMHVSREVADHFSNNDRIACEKFHLKRSMEV